MLLVAAGNVENTGMEWNADQTSVGRGWGRAPTVCEGIGARVTLSTSAQGPIRTKPDGSWEIVQGLPLDAFSKEKIAITEKELLEERATASEALGVKL